MKEGLLIAAGYLIGSMPFGYWLPLAFRRVDIRTIGSGNVGASNVWRSFGARLGLSVLLLDVGKGVAAALLGRYVGDELTGVLAGSAALAGHYRPVFLRFGRGGKVVATTGGVLLGLAPLTSACAIAVWLLAFLATRYASVASLAAGTSLPLVALALGVPEPVLGLSIAAAVVIWVLHRANIKRLLAGTESRARFSVRERLFRRGPAASP